MDIQYKFEFLGERILFLGCHLDDIEYGCGGLIHHLRKNTSIETLGVTMSDHNENAIGEIQLRRNMEEAKRAMEYLDMTEKFRVLDYPGQKLEYKKQEIRESLIELKREFQPSTVVFPARNDIHQDHAALSDEVFRIFRSVNCLGYEIIRSNFDFRPNLYVELNQEDAMAKVNAVGAYQSQITESAGYYFSRDIILSILRFRGTQSGREFAEAYELYMNII